MQVNYQYYPHKAIINDSHKYKCSRIDKSELKMGTDYGKREQNDNFNQELFYGGAVYSW
jgi:hypothetical protein